MMVVDVYVVSKKIVFKHTPGDNMHHKRLLGTGRRRLQVHERLLRQGVERKGISIDGLIFALEDVSNRIERLL